jgi:hypothetical protein
VAISVEKLVIGASLDNPAGFHHNHLITGRHTLQPMGHQHNGAPAFEGAQRFQQKVLVVRWRGCLPLWRPDVMEARENLFPQSCTCQSAGCTLAIRLPRTTGLSAATSTCNTLSEIFTATGFFSHPRLLRASVTW